MKLIAIIPFLICLMIVTNGECISISCVSRASQGEKWVTGRGETFLDPTVLSKHFIADIINDGKKIYKYRIRWFSGSWSSYYFPGQNDNDWTAKSNSDNVWNQAHKNAGRRWWTAFADHSHEVCYLIAGTADTPWPTTQTLTTTSIPTTSKPTTQIQTTDIPTRTQIIDANTSVIEEFGSGISDGDSNENTILIAIIGGVTGVVIAFCMFVLTAFCFCGCIRWKKNDKNQHIKHAQLGEKDGFVMGQETNMYSENQM